MGLPQQLIGSLVLEACKNALLRVKYLEVMGKYAVVEIKGKQYKVEEKEEFLTDFVGEKLIWKVLLVSDGEKVKVGKPNLDKKHVVIKAVEEKLKGDKLRVFKYKAKSRYRKTRGYRHTHSKLLIEKISI